MSEKDVRSLTTKQRRFVEEYLIDFNATRAAQRAGYKGNDNTLRTVGSENLAKPGIAQKIKVLLRAMSMSPDEALMRLGEMARTKHTDYIKPDGTVDLQRLKDDDMMHLVKGTRWVRGELVVEWHDPQRAIDMILKAGGAYKDKGDAPVVNVQFNVEDWKSKRQERLGKVEELIDNEAKNGES